MAVITLKPIEAKASTVSNIARVGLLPAVKIGNLITAGLEKITGKKYARQSTKELSKTTAGKVLGVSTLATAGALAVAVSPSTAGRVVTSAIPKSAVGKALAVVTTGALAVSPTLQEKAIEMPETLLKTGSAIGGKIEGMTPEAQDTAGKFGATGLLVAGAVGLVAGAVTPSIIEKGKDFFAGDQTAPQVEGLVITPTPPITPETVSLEETAPIKTATEPRKQTIKQLVDVRVSQSSRNQSPNRKSVKYINIKRRRR